MKVGGRVGVGEVKVAGLAAETLTTTMKQRSHMTWPCLIGHHSAHEQRPVKDWGFFGSLTQLLINFMTPYQM